MNFKAFLAGFIVVGFLAVAATPADAAGRVSSKGYSSKSYSSSRSYSRSYSRPQSRVQSRPTVPRSMPRQQAPQRPIIQKNYYNNNGGMGGGGYRGGMGGYQGPGIGTSILGGAAGAVGGMMLYDALKGSGSNKEAAQIQRDQVLIQNAKDQQHRDDKMDQMEQKQDQILQNQQRQVLPPQEPFYQLGGQHQ